MRPGSSSVIGSTASPWNRARVCSTPSARSGSTMSANHEVISESRPKSVMNHGAPAVVGIEDAQRTEVLGAAPDDELERREVGFHRGDGAPPSLQPLLGLG